MNTTIILQILTGLAGIISLWIKEYYSEETKAARKEKDENEKTQLGRSDLVAGNVDAVIARIDKLLSKEHSRDARLKNSKTETR